MSTRTKDDDFEAVFGRIREMFRKHEGACVVLHDERHRYYLGTHEVRAKDGYRTWFGGVEIKKSYVSAHLIPVYVYPALLEGMDPSLKKRMQGKSCFNFTKLDDASLTPLGALIAAGADRFMRDGRVRS
jgi:hypothetical protein